jgi:hypothetical protein
LDVKLVRNAFTAPLGVWAVALGIAVYSTYPTRKKFEKMPGSVSLNP